MSKVSDQQVRNFVLKELPLVTNIFLKKITIDDETTLQELYEPEDIAEMAGSFFRYFNVNSDDFFIENYYPWGVKSLFRKKVTCKKLPLTISMFIDSARTGYWKTH